ncbi:MAG: DNA replication and repair protein RecF [bacterium]
MRLERLTLDNFRSYKKKVFHLGGKTLIVAPNGAGKTNVLEAIYLLATGLSERAGVTEEMINFDSEIASVAGVIENNEERTELSVVLTKGVYMGKRTPKRRYLVDGVARNRAGMVGKLPAVLFRPEDMRLIEGSPSRRRGYLDDTLSMAHQDYARALMVYEASLKRRNRLLDAIRDGLARKEQLSYWDQSIIKNGNILTDYRRDYLNYLSGVKTSFGEYGLDYDASTISPARLLQYESAEVAVGYTLVGPHKDDFVIKSENRDLMKYGSRGEQRLAVLFLKIGAMQYTEGKLGVKSVLLLDDIFSELDQIHREEVVKMMDGRQTIVTSAEEDVVPMLPGVEVVRLG